METALRPPRFIDSDDPAVREFAARHAGGGGPLERAVNLAALSPLLYPRLLAHLETGRMKNPQDARRNGDSI